MVKLWHINSERSELLGRERPHRNGGVGTVVKNLRRLSQHGTCPVLKESKCPFHVSTILLCDWPISFWCSHSKHMGGNHFCVGIRGLMLLFKMWRDQRILLSGVDQRGGIATNSDLIQGIHSWVNTQYKGVQQHQLPHRISEHILLRGTVETRWFCLCGMVKGFFKQRGDTSF